jgi:uncharacterized protein (TIRG00374 family)
MKYFLRVVLGVMLLAVGGFVISRIISWDDVKTAVHALSWWNIVLIGGAILTIGIVKAVRFFCILRFGGIVVSLRNTIRIFIASQTFTPLPAGEVGRAMLFKKELGIHLDEVAGPVFLQALLELWTAALWVVLAVSFVGSIGGWMGLVGFLGLLAILSAPLLFSKQLPHVFERLKNHGVTYKWVEKMQGVFEHFEALVTSKGKTNVWGFWVLVVGLGLSSHALSGGLMWYIAQVQGAHITWLQGVFAVTMASLIEGILTIIPGGLGVTEGGLVGILSGFAVPWRKTIIITLIYRLATLPVSMAIALLFLLSTYRAKPPRITHLART